MFDAIVSDIEMPGIGGLEAMRRIRAFAGQASRVYIVALTAQTFPDQVSAMLAAGCEEVLTKPFEPEAFKAVLARVYARLDAG